MNKDEHRAERQREKDEAVRAIERALSAIETDNHEPDQWERAFLVQAVGCLFRGAYRLATVDAQLALTPPSKRSAASNLQLDAPFDQCNISVFREASREAAAEPVRDYPALGPIVFTR
jgi:hypothetical protein